MQSLLPCLTLIAQISALIAKLAKILSNFSNVKKNGEKEYSNI